MPASDRNKLTQHLDALLLLRAGRVLVAAGFVTGAGALGGCTSTGIDDVAPSAQSMLPENAPAPNSAQRGTAAAVPPAAGTGLDAPLETVAAPEAPAGTGGARNTGTFPNLNVKPQAANVQISNPEKQAEVQALRAEQQAHESTIATAGKGTTDPALLRKLAAQHAEEALKKIEGQK
jgi:hypothetical protein